MIKQNKFVTLLVSVIIAFGLWLYVINVVSPESDAWYYNIPVVLQNDNALTERGLMITSEEKPTVTLHLKGNRTDLNAINSGNITLIADLSRIYDAGTQSLSYSIYYPGNVSDGAFETLEQTPRRVSVNVERRITKEVPVKLLTTGNVPSGYICDLDNPVLDREFVSVTGPGSVIDKITQATISVDLTDRVESVTESFRYTLCDEAGEPVDGKQVVADAGEISVLLKIQQVKEIPLKMTIEPGGGATALNSNVDIEPKTITVSGPEALLEGLKEINLGTIKLGELAEDLVDKTYEIRLPEGVTNLSNVTEAKVSVSFPALRTVTFKIENITAVNVPEGLDVEILTKELTVRVRGGKSVMDLMKETDITIEVDMTNVALGASSVRATVIMGKSFTGCGAVGSYSVSVNVVEADKDDGTAGPGA